MDGRSARRTDVEDTATSEIAEPFAIVLGDQLATETEVALAPNAKNPPPETGTAGAATSEAHVPHVEGLNERPLVGAEGLEPPTSAL